MFQKSFRLQVVTPEKIIFDGMLISLVLPAVDGLMGVLPNHAPIVAALATGPLTARTESGQTVQMFISDGFFEMAKNEGRVIAEAGEKSEDIDVTRAEAAEKRARERLVAAGKRGVDIDFVRAERALMRASWRVRVGRRRVHSGAGMH
jgi:F-type H+-transporting ATPase subunit epsilon